jgi:hypothetical protein
MAAPNTISGLVLWLRSNVGRYTTAEGSTAASIANDPVGRWEDGSVSETNLTQSTLASRPTYQTTSPSIRFDGTDDYLSYVGSRTDTVGSLILAFTTGATAFSTRGAQVLFSSANTAVANEWFEVGITSDGRLYIEVNASGTKHTVVGSTYLTVSTSYYLTLVFDGTDYFLLLNNEEENPLTISNVGTFAWLGDITATNLVVGGTVTSAGLVRPFLGDILELALYSADIT